MYSLLPFFVSRNDGIDEISKKRIENEGNEEYKKRTNVLIMKSGDSYELSRPWQQEMDSAPDAENKVLLKRYYQEVHHFKFKIQKDRLTGR